MADSLFLKGYDVVSKQTGNELTCLGLKKTAEFFRTGAGTKEPKQYINGTVFDVTTDGDPLKLVLDTSKSSEIHIVHDGSGGFTFANTREIEIGGLYSVDVDNNPVALTHVFYFSTMPGVANKVVTI